MNQVLKRHPLALHRIRLQLVDAQLLKDTTPVEDEDDVIAQFFLADSSSTGSNGSVKYEESVPTGHFLRTV